jgi:hypothetical protein
MTFTLKSYVEERVPAWVECEHRFNTKDIPAPVMIPGPKYCILCNGAGGKWHESLECRSSHPRAEAHLTGNPHTGEYYATKSSFLVRRWEICTTRNHPILIDAETSELIHMEPCENCTAGEWGVE